jgi:hypothetical protein
LSKNEPLPPSEASIARPWLLGAEAELKCIDDAIHELTSRRDALLPPIYVYRVALAPHKILPTDVLREILLCAALGPVDFGARHLPIQLILCAVSSNWRSVALATHELWSNVQLPGFMTSRRQEILATWLLRGGQHPLVLDIQKVYHDLSELLSLSLHRIRTLIVNCPQPFQDSALGSMNSLETLRFFGNWGEMPKALKTILPGSTRLRSVTLSAFQVGETRRLENIGVPWQQLTNLSIDDMDVPTSQYYRILERCTSLTTASLFIHNLASDLTVQASDQIIALPGLRALVLRGGSLRHFATFLNSLALPSLRDLVLKRTSKEAPGPYHVTTFPILQRLSVLGMGYDHPRLEDWLRASPSAVEIWLPDFFIGESVLNQIADGSLLPRVETLCIYYSEAPTLVATLQARQRSSEYSTITEVGVNDLSRVETPEMAALTELIAIGVFVGSYTVGRNQDRLNRGEVCTSFCCKHSPLIVY